jgi:hypothetical protein
MIRQFLDYDRYRSTRHEIVLQGIETKLSYSMEHPTLGVPMNFVGFIDRVETVDGQLMIWDYKTGSFTSSDLSLGSLNDLWKGTKGKPLQVLLYAWLIYKMEVLEAPLPWSSGMFKLQSGAPEILLGGGALNKTNWITAELLIAFEAALMDYLKEMYINDLPFVELPRYEFN